MGYHLLQNLMAALLLMIILCDWHATQLKALQLTTEATQLFLAQTILENGLIEKNNKEEINRKLSLLHNHAEVQIKAPAGENQMIFKWMEGNHRRQFTIDLPA